MTPAEIALIIANLATLVTAIAGFVALWRKTEIIHKATNGMHKELNDLTAKASKAEGVKQEQDAEAARQAR